MIFPTADRMKIQATARSNRDFMNFSLVCNGEEFQTKSITEERGCSRRVCCILACCTRMLCGSVDILGAFSLRRHETLAVPWKSGASAPRIGALREHGLLGPVVHRG